jgi:ferrous iron transport protein B
MSAQHTIALAGNPNAGKSTVFNALTGARQHVGNWPGKTVEKKEGLWKHGGIEFEVVDLPGTYSLTAYSVEEIIARDYIVDGRPDVVVAVVDAANLERNLYLVVQIIEMGARVVVALNMSDIADSRGLKIDLPKLSAGLGGIPVVPTVASKGKGIDQLKEAIVNTINEEGQA